MMAVSLRTASPTPSSSGAGCSSRFHTVLERAHEVRRRRQRAGRVLESARPRCGPAPPDGDSGARVRRPDARGARAGGRLAAPRHAWRRPRSTARWRSPPTARGRSRTLGRIDDRLSSVVENIPKPPPFQGLRPAVLARVTCAPATASNSATGHHRAPSCGVSRSGTVRIRRHCSTTTLYPVETRVVIRWTALRVRRASNDARSCSLAGSVVMIAPAGGPTTW